MSVLQALYPRKSSPDSRGGLLLPGYKSGQPEWTDWDTDAAINDGFKSSVWVYRCLSALADMVSSLPWYVERPVGDEWERVEGHPAEELLEAPNPFFGRRELIERVILHLGLAGEAYLLKTMIRNQPVELWPVDPRGMQPIPNRALWIEGYKYEYDGVLESFKPEQIIQFLLPDPATPYRGLSPLKAAARAVDTDVEAATWRKLSLQNRLGVDGVLSFPQPLAKAQWEEARAAVKLRHTGSEAERFLILSGGATFAATSVTARDSQVSEGTSLNREEICAAFGFPPSYFGIGDPTFSNFATAEKVAWRNTAIPAAHRLAAALSRSLMPHFGGEKDLWLRFDTSGVEALKSDLVAKAQVYAALVQNQVKPEAAAGVVELDLEADDFKEPAPNPFADSPDGNDPSQLGEDGSDTATKPDNDELPQPAAAQGNAKEFKAKRDERKLALAELDKIADQLAPELADLFLRASKKMSKTIPAEELVDMLTRSGVDDLVKRLDFGILAEQLKSFIAPLIKAFTAAGEVAARQLAKTLGKVVGFDGGQAAMWAEDRTRTMVDQVVKATERGARRTFEAAKGALVPEALGRSGMSRFLRKALLLTAPQSDQMKEYIRTLRAAGRSQMEISQAVSEWIDATLLKRAEGIGASEAYSSVVAGQADSARQAAQSGILRSGVKEWVTRESWGEQPCPICWPMDGNRIPLDEEFWLEHAANADGTKGKFVPWPGPTYVHANCYCGALIYEAEVTQP